MLGAKLDGGAAVRPRGHFKTDAGGEARPLSEGSMLMGSSLSIVFFLSLEFQSHLLAARLHSSFPDRGSADFKTLWDRSLAFGVPKCT